MKTYRVPVVWQMYGYVTVEAESLSEAQHEAMDAPLPEEGSYVEGSFEIDGSSFTFVDAADSTETVG